MTTRHFAWFRQETGHWIGEWAGLVPAPVVPPGLIGEARLSVLNAWQQQIASVISPALGAGDQAEPPTLKAGRARPGVSQMVEPVVAAGAGVGRAGFARHGLIVTREATWDLDAWDDCPAGGAVCLDVTMYGWPVGDFYWAVFDGVDRLIDFRDMRAYLQLTPATALVDASAHSPRPLRSMPHKLVADVTGTPLEPWVDHIQGQLVRRDGRIAFEPFTAGVLPEAVVLSITDSNKDLTMVHSLDPVTIPLCVNQ